jgi:hypothetical protein
MIQKLMISLQYLHLFIVHREPMTQKYGIFVKPLKKFLNGKKTGRQLEALNFLNHYEKLLFDN